jgi:hypothetical protein
VLFFLTIWEGGDALGYRIKKKGGEGNGSETPCSGLRKNVLGHQMKVCRGVLRMMREVDRNRRGIFKKNCCSQVWWCMPVISATQEVEVGESWSEDGLG